MPDHISVGFNCPSCGGKVTGAEVAGQSETMAVCQECRKTYGTWSDALKRGRGEAKKHALSVARQALKKGFGKRR